MSKACECKGAGRKKTYDPVTHIVFDLDGLLLDTECVYQSVFQRIAGQYGKTYTQEIRVKVLGTPEFDSARIAVEEMNLPLSPQEFLDMYRPICKTELQHPPIMPGVERLIRHLGKHHIPFAIATSGYAEITEIKLTDFRPLLSHVDHVVCGDDPLVKAGKPAPYIYLAAAARFPDNPDPSKCLAFEDAPNGVMAARGAGMQCVMVPPSEVPDDHPARKEATLVLKTMEHFVPEQFGLPPYDDMY